ncbi:MAG: hypothetical protein HND44_16395 [Chloroflexi bacterium]|nr:ORF6C domain-containing protein [Ardenticatenaceae bacterium]MBL1130039.1 hypothetical protein [Chloroflexota bacterium]NOG36126.1 hypothetical protein [Chloroflexota bacterium]GIK57857.1 MAG: hypothetical protein BroJett015_35200 [Chloroflexota bacterium]
MSDEKALVPVEQKQVEFYGDELTAVRGNDGHVYVAIGQMCDALGIDRASQTRRIRSDEVLATGYQGSVNLTYPDGGTQASGVLRIDLIPLWLTGLRTKAVREDVRPKLERFKREAAKALWEAFQEGRLTADSDFDTLLQQASQDTVEAYQMALAMVKLARNQILLEARMDTHGRLLEDYGRRLADVEATLSNPAQFITREQASRISQAVRAIGHVLSERNGRSEYGAVYGELYRNFEISAYRELPAQKYDEAIKWLNAWYQRLTNQDIPF